MNGTFDMSKIQSNFKKVRNIVIIVAILIVLSIIGSTCWYTVNDTQQAVVTTFGKVTAVTSAGMHFKVPFGIQKVEKVDVNVFRKIEIGYRSTGDYLGYETYEKESKMITGDYNIVNVDFFIEYKVSDPEKYLYNSDSPEEILTNLIQSQIRNVIGSTEVDKILTTGKNEIQTRVKELVVEELEAYDIGLMLSDVKIQDAEPPTTAVIEAFKAVETAKQIAETAINQAKAYQNAEIPKANAEADKLINNAEYLKQNRINEATKTIAKFEAMYNEYKNNPELTRTRMYYEAISEILPGVKIYIDSSDGSTQKLLPLDNFNTTGGTAQ